MLMTRPSERSWSCEIVSSTVMCSHTFIYLAFIYFFLYICEDSLLWLVGGLKQIWSSSAFSSEDGELLILCSWWFRSPAIFQASDSTSASACEATQQCRQVNRRPTPRTPGLVWSLLHRNYKGVFKWRCHLRYSGFLLHFFIYLIFPSEKQAIILSGKVLEGGNLGERVSRKISSSNEHFTFAMPWNNLICPGHQIRRTSDFCTFGPLYQLHSVSILELALYFTLSLGLLLSLFTGPIFLISFVESKKKMKFCCKNGTTLVKN